MLTALIRLWLWITIVFTATLNFAEIFPANCVLVGRSISFMSFGEFLNLIKLWKPDESSVSSFALFCRGFFSINIVFFFSFGPAIIIYKVSNILNGLIRKNDFLFLLLNYELLQWHIGINRRDPILNISNILIFNIQFLSIFFIHIFQPRRRWYSIFQVRQSFVSKCCSESWLARRCLLASDRI